jgi:hypothetical protein
MTNIQRLLPLAALATAAVLLLAACNGAPFSVDTDEEQVDVPIQSSLYNQVAEKAIPIPDDAKRDNVEYEKVELNYEITTNVSADVTVELYASTDEEADGSKKDDDEVLFQVTVSDGNPVSGSEASDAIEEALNNQQDAFVIGGVAASSTGVGQNVQLTISATIEGRATVF